MMKRIALLALAAVMLAGLWPMAALADNLTPYDMGIPQLNGRRYTDGDMNMAVFWVQVQMKATGRFYQEEQWDCTGNLGSHTMHEVASFMRSRGYGSHSGRVDQNVVNELASYLGGRVQPVYVGGFYDAMGAIMTGGSTGSMTSIVSNLRDMVPRETVGARWVQVCLRHLGYYTSGIDGKYGEGTERAVKAFQRDYGFEQRDYVTLGVARAMIEAFYHAGGDLYSLPAWTPSGRRGGDIASGWVTRCDAFINGYGNLCFDMSRDKPSDSVIMYFVRDEMNPTLRQGALNGTLLWDSPAYGVIHEYAIWCGPASDSDALMSITEGQIPSSAWIRLYVTPDSGIVIVSSRVSVNVR